MDQGIGDRFQQETKYQRGKLPAGHLDWSKKPDRYKVYPRAKKIKLEPPQREGGTPFWKTIERRRSCRAFGERPLSREALSQLLWASQGVTKTYKDFELRAAPSAGALYPIETYLAALNVDGIEPGLYHYDVRPHELELLKPGDFRESVACAALDQDFMAEAGAVFIWAAMFERTKWKYKQRAYRYIYLDTGQIAQNLALAAVSLGLGSCQIGALYDDEVNALLDIDGDEESVVYMTAVGMLQE